MKSTMRHIYIDGAHRSNDRFITRNQHSSTKISLVLSPLCAFSPEVYAKQNVGVAGAKAQVVVDGETYYHSLGNENVNILQSLNPQAVISPHQFGNFNTGGNGLQLTNATVPTSNYLFDTLENPPGQNQPLQGLIQKGLEQKGTSLEVPPGLCNDDYLLLVRPKLNMITVHPIESQQKRRNLPSQSKSKTSQHSRPSSLPLREKRSDPVTVSAKGDGGTQTADNIQEGSKSFYLGNSSDSVSKLEEANRILGDALRA